jgi:hypothetical protein
MDLCDTLRWYRERLTTMQAALVRLTDENQRLLEQIQQLEQVLADLRRQDCRC